MRNRSSINKWFLQRIIRIVLYETINNCAEYNRVSKTQIFSTSVLWSSENTESRFCGQRKTLTSIMIGVKHRHFVTRAEVSHSYCNNLELGSRECQITLTSIAISGKLQILLPQHKITMISIETSGKNPTHGAMVHFLKWESQYRKNSYIDYSYVTVNYCVA